ncbi:MAG: ABC transporter permease subunit [Actinomycetota bacterium]
MDVAVGRPVAGRPRSPRRTVLVVAGAALAWSVGRAGIDGAIVNGGGQAAFGRFWTAVVDPETGSTFLRLTLDAAAVTASYAILGTFASLLLAALVAPALSQLVAPAPLRLVARVLLVVPRSVHEILWALLAIQVLGFDPLVAVLAIAIPFGAVSAKVFAETIDEADPGPYHTLRAAGARRFTALAYGVWPTISGELTSYAFYRLECGIRSAAVLGVIGAGGLGFQLDLSFETLRYGEIWTLLAALVLLSGAADSWSAAVRRRPGPGVRRLSMAAFAVLVPLSWWWVELDPRTLWSARTRTLAVDLAADVWPPRLGLGGWGELVSASIDTVAMSILALALAGGGGLLVAATAARPHGRALRPGPGRRLAGIATRFGLLVLRAVPAPVWAFLMVLVLFPGLWPGAVALGLYNLGVVGRLLAEAVEERDPGPADALVLNGTPPLLRWCYATLPTAGPRMAAIVFYRWEVIVRETVVVGVVGAGGLGQLINGHLAARDFAAVVGAVGAMVVIALVIDGVSNQLRRRLR